MVRAEAKEVKTSAERTRRKRPFSGGSSRIMAPESTITHNSLLQQDTGRGIHLKINKNKNTHTHTQEKGYSFTGRNFTLPLDVKEILD